MNSPLKPVNATRPYPGPCPGPYPGHCPGKHRPAAQRGVSLIEVMISLFVFGIGVLGFAALQSRAVQATFDNGQRDQVVWLTQSVIDRIRGNDGAARKYAELLTNYNSGTCPASASAQPKRCTGSTTLDTNSQCANCCSADEMAEFDVWDLYCRSDFQGANAIKGLSVNLTCTDARSNAACTTTSTQANLELEHKWCARSVESNADLSRAAADPCDNTVAQMTYNVAFRP